MQDRWLLLLFENLLQSKITHAEIHKKLKNGCFSLKRTEKTVFKIASRSHGSCKGARIGNGGHEDFIKERKSNPRFQEKVKKQKILSFVKEGANFKLTNKNNIMEEKMKHDLFGSI